LQELKILSPTAILGYGFPEDSFQKGLEQNPDFIAVDAGSTDPGPHYLGAGVSFTDREAVKRDLKLMIKAGKKLGIPILVGTAGGSGANIHLAWTEDIVEEIAKEENLKLKVALISAEIPKEEILKKYEEGKIGPLPPAGEVSREAIESTSRIVAQMGVEPIMEALDNDVDLVLAGRAFDPTVFAAPCIKAGFPVGLALHMGKILECASIAATPGSGSDCMLGTLKQDCFILETPNPDRKCTVTSIAAHTLYEKNNPYKLYGPGGIIDLEETKFTQLDDRRVKVSGSQFMPSEEYTIKLEGARKIGYRTISIGGTRDPIMIRQIDDILEAVKSMTRRNFSHESTDDYEILFAIYGRDGVMGKLEPNKDMKPHELGIIIEVIARTQELANTICSFTRSSLLHYGYPGRIATAGNLAFRYSPSDIPAGEVYEFSLYHLLTVEDPKEYFPVTLKELGWDLP
jgi:hypothetical protein